MTSTASDPSPTGIVVGIDGSEGARRALRWAVGEGVRRGWEVTALLAWTYLDQHHPGKQQRFEPEYGPDDALAALDDHVVAELGAEVARTVRRRVVCDHATSALVDASHDAALLVVGARGLGGFRGALLGSVSSACLHHAACPVAVVRDAPEVEVGEHGRARVVVGVDGSDASQRALRWAVDEARARRAALDVVHVWTIPVTTVHPLVPATFPVDFSAMEDAARDVLERSMAGVDLHGMEHPVERLIVEGPTARSILDVAKGADLLVVGSRGRGGFAGLLLGSVSTQVTHHAECPVVVVPAEDRRT